MENAVTFAELMTTVRYRDTARMKKAMEVQDQLREKSATWDATGEVRKWRDTRHGTAGA